jgi:Leucine-rich repeat (LRR) protein
MSQSPFKVLNRFNRRWTRFSLRVVLIATASLALWLGQIVSRVQNQTWVVSHVQETGGRVWFETDQPRFVEHWLNPDRIPSTVASGSDWFRTALGADYFRNAVQIDFGNATEKGVEQPNFKELGPRLGKLRQLQTIRIEGRDFSDEILADLSKHSNLTRLHSLFVDGLVTDDGIKRIDGFHGLQTLSLPYTKITDDGISNLARLPNLHSLFLYSSDLTEHGVAAVLDLPNLKNVVLYDCSISEDRFRSLADRRPGIKAELYFTSRHRNAK